MSAPTETSAGTAAIRPFTVPVIPSGTGGAACAVAVAGHELVTDHSQGPKRRSCGTRPLLGGGIRLAAVRARS